MSAQPSSVPTTVSAAAAAWAQPLAQPEMWIVNAPFEVWRRRRGDAGREGARRDMRRGANRRAGAGDDMPARIVGANDKAELFGSDDKAGRGLGLKPDGDEYPSRCRAQTACSGRGCGIDQSSKHGRIGVAEAEADAAGHRTIAQPMHADRLIADARGRRRRVVDEKPGDGGAKCDGPFGGENIARARVAPPFCHHVEQPQDRFDALRRLDRRRDRSRWYRHRQRRREAERRPLSLRAQRRISAARPARSSAPPPSITTETFGEKFRG